MHVRHDILIGVVAALTAASGLVVLARMREATIRR